MCHRLSREDSCHEGFRQCCEPTACCLLPAQPAAACLSFKSPEMAEQRKMAVAQAVGEAAGRPASKQAFLQLRAPVRHGGAQGWALRYKGKWEPARMKTTQAHAWSPPKGTAGPGEISSGQKPEAMGRWLIRQQMGTPASCPAAQSSYPGRIPGTAQGLAWGGGS